MEDEYITEISVYQGMNEQANSLTRFPKRTFMVGYNLVNLATEWYTIHNFHTSLRGQWDVFWFFDFLSRNWTDVYVGVGDGATTTFDLHSKNTVNDSSLIIKVNGTPVSKSFSSGTGTGGADRVTITAPAIGHLITSDFKGQLRIKARKADKFSDKFDLDESGNIEAFLIREVQW